MVSCCFAYHTVRSPLAAVSSRLPLDLPAFYVLIRKSSLSPQTSLHRQTHTHTPVSRADTKRRPQQNGKLRSTFVIPIFHFVSLNNKSPRVRHLLHLPIVSVLFIKLHKTCKYKFPYYCQKFEPANCKQKESSNVFEKERERERAINQTLHLSSLIMTLV